MTLLVLAASSHRTAETTELSCSHAGYTSPTGRLVMSSATGYRRSLRASFADSPDGIGTVVVVVVVAVAVAGLSAILS